MKKLIKVWCDVGLWWSLKHLTPLGWGVLLRPHTTSLWPDCCGLSHILISATISITLYIATSLIRDTISPRVTLPLSILCNYKKLQTLFISFFSLVSFKFKGYIDNTWYFEVGRHQKKKKYVYILLKFLPQLP